MTSSEAEAQYHLPQSSAEAHEFGASRGQADEHEKVNEVALSKRIEKPSEACLLAVTQSPSQEARQERHYRVNALAV